MCFINLNKYPIKVKSRKYITPHLLIGLLFFLFTQGAGVFAQITLTTPNISPSYAVTDILLGAGVTASNITFNGGGFLSEDDPHNSVREFTNTSPVFPLSDGVLMQTNGGGFIVDADLVAITTNTVKNGTIIEFDFVPDGDSLSFSYIFTSSEYSSYTCSAYNDAFGFFISGPGISGPYSNNSQNIAIVPGSNNIPVGINSVNSGSTTGSGSASFCNKVDQNWQANSVYFTKDYNSIYNNSPDINAYPKFNGSTNELTAGASVICGETYHIKLAIANVGDNQNDSGVFLRAGSFSSESLIKLNSSNTTSSFLDSVIVEGCDEGAFCFSRSPTQNIDTTVIHYSISGSADLGVDYTFTNMPNQGDSIILLPGQNEFCLETIPIDDGITEGLENIVISTFTINACGDTMYSVAELWIADRPADLIPSAGQDTVVCNESAVTLKGVGTVSTNHVEWTFSGPGTVTFTPDKHDLNADVTFSTPGVYTLFLTETNDTCALQEIDSIDISYFSSEQFIKLNSANTTSSFLDSVIVKGCDEGAFCFSRSPAQNSDTTVIYYSISGSADLGVDYTFTNMPNQGDSILLLPGQNEFCLEIIPIDNGITKDLKNVVLTTLAVDACGETIHIVGGLWIADKPIDLTPSAGQDIVVCSGDVGTLNGTGTVSANHVEWTFTGPGTVTFAPDEHDLNADVTFSTPGVYTLFLTETNDTCALQEVDSISVIYSEVGLIVSNDTTICQNGKATMIANASGGNSIDYHWSHTSDLGSVQSVLPTAQTSYIVFAENELGCLSETETITVDVSPPLDLTSSDSQTICPGESININTTVSGGDGGPYNYVWTNAAGENLGMEEVLNVSPFVTTVYTITLTDNCETTSVVSTSEVVVVDELPEILFSVVDGELCTPAEFKLVNDTDPLLVQDIYWYTSNGQTFVNNDSISVFISQAGSYDVQMVIVTPDGCVDSSSVNNMLTVNPSPEANFTYYPKPATILNTEVHFQNHSTGADYYEWVFEGGNPSFSSLKNPYTTFLEGEVGTYEVELIAISTFDCHDTLRQIVSVVPEVFIFAPNSFTPDGDELNPTWKPIIEGIDKMNVDIEIYNRWGEIVWESHDLDVGWDGTYIGGVGLVKSGTYIWKIKAQDLINDNKYEWEGIVTVLY